MPTPTRITKGSGRSLGAARPQDGHPGRQREPARVCPKAHTHQDQQSRPPRASGRPWGLTGPKAGPKMASETQQDGLCRSLGAARPKTGTQGGNVSQRESAPRPTPTRISKAGPQGLLAGPGGSQAPRQAPRWPATLSRMASAGPWGLPGPRQAPREAT